MKVRDLRKALNGVDGDHEVVLSRDAEGNGFSPAIQVSAAHYVEETTWQGYVTHREDAEHGPDNALVLWPTN